MTSADSSQSNSRRWDIKDSAEWDRSRQLREVIGDIQHETYDYDGSMMMYKENAGDDVWISADSSLLTEVRP